MGFLLHLFFFVFLDVLGFSIVLPLIPYYAKEFGSPPSIVGALLTSNALAQFFTAPFIGRLSDVYGRRPLLLICIAGTLLSFIVMVVAQSIEALFISRILDGLLGGNISLAQAYITDVTSEAERSKGFGLLGASFGLAFIFGPALGAVILTNFSTRVPPIVASVLCLLNLISIYLYLPESLNSNPNTVKSNTKAENKITPPIPTTTQSSRWLSWWFDTHFPLAVMVAPIIPYFTMRFFFGFIFTLFETTLGLYNIDVLGLQARESNLVLVYIGLFFSGVQMAIRRLLMRGQEPIKEIEIIWIGFCVLGLSLFAWPWIAHSTLALLVVLLPFSLAAGVLNTLIGSALTKQAPQGSAGTILGVSASIGCLTRVLAPISGAAFFEKFGFYSPGMIGGVLALICAYYSNNHRLRQQ
eukprot:TRINITY_DN16638_c0_g1_i1.p1 TRINITY_DN16638_c0_g1~~TRINITY_DN16638_c0_g1_i1.p1  ORF type:complete len:453 (-),score=53.47 TRINITY_DN16638_c0_g1_i1:285-1520(-)